MSLEKDIPLHASAEVIDTILNGNNNFVSTLDHLPCDITRSLWFVQMMNLRSSRLEKELSKLTESEGLVNFEVINRLKNLIVKYNAEAERESEYAVEILNNHLNYLKDDRDIVSLLKSKLPGWTSEAVERRWIEWGRYKRDFLQTRKQTIENGTNEDAKSIFNNFKIVSENVKHPSPRPKVVKEKELLRKVNPQVINGVNEMVDQKIKSSSKRKSDDKSKPENKSTTKRPNASNSREPTKLILKAPSAPIPAAAPLLPEAPPVVETPLVAVIPTTVPEEVYCFCRGPSLGRMVACEYEKCPFEWFHFKCVGLSKEPEGDWFCSDSCKEKHEAALQRKLKRKKSKGKRMNW